ncbi:MAG: LytTR family DNA-binding domain-containing protein [Pseudomonadota bacterium]
MALSNATVLGVAPLSRALPAVGIVLVALFVFVKPEATSGYPFLARLGFWSVHIGAGLGSIVLASALLRPSAVHRLPLAIALLLTGLTGAALLAPVYWLLELLTPAELVAAPDDWLDHYAAGGALQAVIAEFIEVAPMFVGAWFAVNLPLLLRKEQAATADPAPSAPSPPILPEPNKSPSAHESGPPPAPHPDLAPHQPSERRAPRGVLARLPRALGDDVVAISSDMHYLHVHTTLGKCMLLGTLRDAATELGDQGLLVHRSHWVAHAHVRRILRRGAAWECLMSTDLRVPVSRRKQSEVAQWYGQSGDGVAMSARETG